ncbi:hypothetical protein ACVI1I_006865 [Bradyrhizobium sp. USDA 4459]
MKESFDCRDSGPLRPRHDLHQAEAPAAALGDVFLQPFRRETDRQSLVEIDRGETAFLQAQRDEIVFCHRVGREAADSHEPGIADERRGAAAEGDAPGILRRQ